MINRKSQTHKRKLLFLVKLVLVLMLGHLIIRTAVTPENVRETLAPKSAGGSERVIAAEPGGAEKSPPEDYSAVLERDLFGNRASGLSTGESVPADGRQSLVLPVGDNLKVALLGTVAGSPAISRAIIKNLETNVLGQYKTGDTILTASIERIERDRVVLIDKGQRRVLTLHAPELVPGGGNSGQALARTTVPKPIPVAKAPAAPATFANKLRHVAIMLPEATVEPHTVKGEVEGLKVSDLGDVDGVEDLGLKDGDVIRAINGHRLNSKQKAFQIAMKAKSQAALSVELQRDNKIKNFSLPLK